MQYMILRGEAWPQSGAIWSMVGSLPISRRAQRLRWRTVESAMHMHMHMHPLAGLAMAKEEGKDGINVPLLRSDKTKRLMWSGREQTIYGFQKLCQTLRTQSASCAGMPPHRRPCPMPTDGQHMTTFTGLPAFRMLPELNCSAWKSHRSISAVLDSGGNDDLPGSTRDSVRLIEFQSESCHTITDVMNCVKSSYDFRWRDEWCLDMIITCPFPTQASGAAHRLLRAYAITFEDFRETRGAADSNQLICKIKDYCIRRGSLVLHFLVPCAIGGTRLQVTDTVPVRYE